LALATVLAALTAICGRDGMDGLQLDLSHWPASSAYAASYTGHQKNG
jgi:hypothetical protein